MIDFTKPLRVDTPARAGMGAVDAAYAAGWCDACIGKQYGTQKPTPEQAAALQPGEAQEDDRTAALQRVRQIALQSETAPLSMCEIIKRVDIALGEETPLPDWFFAAIKDAPPAAQVTATDLERIAADFEKDSNLDRYICCNGRDCGCQGATAGTYAAYKIRALAGDGK